MKKITVITGHYGSGKTNLSVNLAVKAAQEGKKVTVVDLDLVNPYFRTADFREMFADMGIKLIAPDFANSSISNSSLKVRAVLLSTSAEMTPELSLSDDSLRLSTATGMSLICSM